MQKLRLVALLVLEIRRHKISLGRRERVIKFSYLPPENEFNFEKKKSFYVQNRSSQLKIDPCVNFSNIQAEENFSFSKFLGRLNEKRAAATPWLVNFAKIWSERVLRIKAKTHQVWTS